MNKHVHTPSFGIMRFQTLGLQTKKPILIPDLESTLVCVLNCSNYHFVIYHGLCMYYFTDFTSTPSPDKKDHRPMCLAPWNPPIPHNSTMPRKCLTHFNSQTLTAL